MPELPEVETIARTLREGPPVSLLGREILTASLRWPRTLAEPGKGPFLRRVRGQSIQAIGRRAKFLVFDLSRDKLVIHLRMSGDIVIRRNGEKPAVHDRLILGLSGDLTLAFNDPRKFGRAWLVADTTELFAKLGPEPLSAEFTPALFFQILRARRRQLKPLLLDQQFLAGMGNIYTDEALHRARLHPLLTSDELTRRETGRLWQAIRAVLDEGIARQGASIDWVYRGGEFQNTFRVYSRTGEACQRCGHVIQRILVGQRSTHFCPNCQPSR